MKSQSIYNTGDFVFPGGKSKALVFSFDDGVEHDKKLVAMFNKYGLHGTFNINSGKLGQRFDYYSEIFEGSAYYLSKEELKEVFMGHEVAAHTVNHPHLINATREFVLEETTADIEALEAIVEYPIISFAYPFGDANDTIAAYLGSTTFKNARTIKNTHSFKLPTDFLLWHPTCHHSEAVSLIDDFLSPANCPSVFYIWGHSWELDGTDENNNWHYMENLCNRLSGKSDIWYTTVGELSEYLNAIRLVEVHGSNVTNTSQITVYIITGDKIKKLTPGDECKL